VTFAFGLVHGFGFASTLSDIGLPARALVPALAAFNIGGEVGQVVIVPVIVPLLLWSDRIGGGRAVPRERRPALVYICSAMILLLGVYWLIARKVLV
jgi:HupE / UreJ protein